jgi:hypothetical protein
MGKRVWDRFLTDQDRARSARQPTVRKGAGGRPVVLLVDLYRSVFGDEPEPLLESIRSGPGAAGSPNSGPCHTSSGSSARLAR